MIERRERREINPFLFNSHFPDISNAYKDLKLPGDLDELPIINSAIAHKSIVCFNYNGISFMLFL
jgi:hypothetical protein